MRHGRLCVRVLTAIVIVHCISVGNAQTQMEMNEEAGARLRAADAEMKKVIGELESKANGRPKALEVLRNAQAGWEKYRDAQLRAMWPFPETTWYGSVNPMCFADVKAEMTRVRTRELRAMLNPTETDACVSRWPE